LITERRIRRKKLYSKLKLNAFKLSKEKKAKYEKILSQFIKERKALHHKKEEAAEPKKEEKKVAAPVQKGKDAPKKTEAPKKEAPKKEAPKQEVSKKEAPKKQEAPKKEAPKKGGK